MPIVFWVSALLAAASAISHYSTVDGKTHLTFRGARGAALLLERDDTIVPAAPVESIKVIGEVHGHALVLVDTYQSKSGGLSYCQAGKEQFLRVVSLTGSVPKETLRVKLASCWGNIELATPGLTWNARSAKLEIHWLAGERGEAEDRAYKISTNGNAQLILPSPPPPARFRKLVEP